jgi:hypothetical protein
VEEHLASGPVVAAAENHSHGEGGPGVSFLVLINDYRAAAVAEVREPGGGEKATETLQVTAPPWNT